MTADPRPAPARSWRRAAIAFVLFGGLGLVFLFGLPAMGIDGAAAARRALGLARGPWALPAVVIAFAVLAFLGVPQVVLIGAAVFAFGPWPGAIYSWAGTLVSALVGFGLGRAFGARLLAELPGAGVRRFVDVVGRNGLIASLVVRLTPFAPFVMVNMAAGVTPMAWLSFGIGTAIGIAPKIVVIAFAGHSVLAGGAGSLIWLAAAVGVWLIAGLLAGRWLRRGSAP